MKLWIAHLAIVILNWAQPLNSVTWLGQLSERENILGYDSYYKGCVVGYTHDLDLNNLDKSFIFCKKNLLNLKEYSKNHPKGP